MTSHADTSVEVTINIRKPEEVTGASFRVPRALLGSRSAWIEEELRSQHTVTITRRFAGHLRAVFREYIAYLKTGSIPDTCSSPLYITDPNVARYAYLFYLFALGTIVRDVQLQNDVMDFLVRVVQEYRGTARHPLPSDNTVHFAYDSVPRGSPLRRFCVDLMIWAGDAERFGWNDEDHKSLKATAKVFPKEFIKDMARELTRVLIDAGSEEVRFAVMVSLKELVLKAPAGMDAIEDAMSKNEPALALKTAIINNSDPAGILEAVATLMDIRERSRGVIGIPQGITEQNYHVGSLGGAKRKQDEQEGEQQQQNPARRRSGETDAQRPSLNTGQSPSRVIHGFSVARNSGQTIRSSRRKANQDSFSQGAATILVSASHGQPCQPVITVTAPSPPLATSSPYPNGYDNSLQIGVSTGSLSQRQVPNDRASSDVCSTSCLVHGERTSSQGDAQGGKSSALWHALTAPPPLPPARRHTPHPGYPSNPYAPLDGFYPIYYPVARQNPATDYTAPQQFNYAGYAIPPQSYSPNYTTPQLNYQANFPVPVQSYHPLNYVPHQQNYTIPLRIQAPSHASAAQSTDFRGVSSMQPPEKSPAPGQDGKTD
ncbi:Hypothetical predicted protein [Lecanosticta acicola]|uniref:Uncharacterized protein n=1 Tax=Lecanosticta acicola TaxID=111012 RepID=A0AAI9EC11_9PEZI|nr:Hypothetical predicted protein [Lecanosticta acicola]